MILISAMALLLFSSPAAASSCKETPFDVLLASSTAIFTGKVVNRDGLKTSWQWLWARIFNRSPCGEKVVTLNVDQVWKGKVQPEVRVYSADGCYHLGSYFSLGETYVVFGYPPTPGVAPADFEADVCFGTVAVKHSGQKIQLLNQALKRLK